MKLVSVVTPCLNEQDNLHELYTRVAAVMRALPFEYEHIFIDNASTDGTVGVLRGLAAQDSRVKVILNTRNFGHVRSPYHALLQARGDAVVAMASDLQDPPEKIPEFIAKWEQGYKVVIGVKTQSHDSAVFHMMRTMYYRALRGLSDVPLIENFTGFGLYDQEVISLLRQFNDPYPYFRGLIADIGFAVAQIAFTQPRRTRGFSKNNLYSLFDLAMLGLVSYTKIPLRLATLLGFASAALSFLIGTVYLVYKLVNWANFSLGLAPVVIGLFFLGSVQLFFLGVVGEYIGSIYTLAIRRPLVIEKERINF